MTDKDMFLMDLNTEGTPFDRAVQVGACPGGEAFLLVNDRVSVLFESGYGCSGAAMAARIAAELQERPLDYILLTHSHYDHALGSPFCRARWPEVKVAAAGYAARIFAKPGARKTMREMDACAARMNGIRLYEDRVDELAVDLPVEDGDELSLHGLPMRAVALPGHTRCSFGYWFPESRTLFASESIGVYEGGDLIAPSYLVGYGMAMDSIERVRALRPAHMLLPHNGFLHGEDCLAYLDRAADLAAACRDLILRELRAGQSEAEVCRKVKEIYYLARARKVQPEEAFDLNTQYQVALIRKEFM